MLLNLIENDTEEDCEVVKVILRILVHCFCGPETPSTNAPALSGTSSFGTPALAERFRSPADALASLSQKKISKHPRYFHEDNKTANVLKRAWQTAQLNNAIMILIAYIREPHPTTEADSLRAISCRALNGLARHEHISQILSQLPLIVNNEIAVLMREPILQDKHIEHAEFRQQACNLIQIVHKTPLELISQENMTLGTMWKNLVIKQTSIRYDDNELLKMIQDHLRNKGLNETANLLEKEAGPLLDLVPSKSLIMPRTEIADTNQNIDNPVDANETIGSVVSLPNNDCPHSTPKSTFQKTKLPTSNLRNFQNMKTRHNITIATPKTSLHGRTLSESKRRTIGSSSLLAQSSMPFSNRHQENAYSYVQQPVELKPNKSLNEIVTEYFRHQHSSCERPIVTCPPFSFYFPHRCPKPQATYSVPINVVDRFLARQALPYRQTHSMLNRHDRNMLFSHYSPVRFYDVEDEAITACNLSGTYSGEVQFINLETGTMEMAANCQSSIVASIKQSTDGSLLLTSSLYMRPLSSLWRVGDSLEVVHTFQEDIDMDFGKLSSERIIGTQMHSAFVSIYDTETGELISSFYDPNPINKYARNKACFNCTDTLILNDGTIWDVRAGPTNYVHKFDKLSNEYSGLFHPNDVEVLICGQVWDVRNFKLLLNVPSLESCDYFFNRTGDILFATTVTPQEDEYDTHLCVKYDSSFRVIDSKDYHVVTTYDTKRDILGFCPDHRDKFICTVEMNRNREDEQTFCRLYEIGKIKSDNNEEDEDDGKSLLKSFNKYHICLENDDQDEDDSSNSSFDSQSSVSTTELLIQGYENFEPVNGQENAEDEESSESSEDNDEEYDEFVFDDGQSMTGQSDQDLDYYDEQDFDSDEENEN
ncbi:LisH domain-containing protein [Aphelenchoides bicaudatus]|nr:LisH domain-containing protein [Aphelenchoides bicaudatus]